MKKQDICTALCLLTFSAGAFADEIASSIGPNAGLFIGLGGSYNSIRLEQQVGGTAVSNVYSGSTLVAYGEAGGPATALDSTHSTFAPDIQLGYFDHFNDSPWLGGIKLSYKYLGLTVTDSPVDLPQGGTFTPVGGSPDTFTGNAVIQSAQTTINHEFALIAFIGRSFKNAYAYLGAGPALFGVKSDLLNGTGYADINGVHFDVTGTPVSFSHSDWIWGAVAQVGMTYYVDPSWFVDFNYTYARTAEYTTNDSAPFSSFSNGYTTTGILYVNNTERVTTQGFGITVNKLFSLF